MRVTSTAICGSDLHLYGVLGMFLDAGDVLGHETMGVVEEVGPEAGNLRVGDRVVVPFNIACGHCWMCERGLQTQCETTQVRSQDKGAALFGYTKLYGQVPGGQAQYLRVPQAQYGPVVVPDDGSRTSGTSTCPTCCPPRGRPSSTPTCRPAARSWCWGSARSARCPRGSRCTAARPASSGSSASRSGGRWPSATASRPSTRRRSTTSSARCATHVRPRRGLGHRRRRDGGARLPVAEATQKVVGVLPDVLAAPLTERAATDRLAALYTAIDLVRRGGTISISGVYGGRRTPCP